MRSEPLSSRKTPRLLLVAMLVGTSTMASRITGFMRDIFLAALLGAGPFAEIFVIAFRLPNLFRRLFAEGAFNAAFVPMFSEWLEKQGQAAALEFAARIASVLVATLVAFTILAQIFMPGLVFALAQGFVGTPEKFDLAVHYARISFPYLICMSLVSLFAGMLNSTGRFFVAAFSPILLNLVLLLAMAMAVAFQGLVLDYVIWGVVVAGVAQLGFVFVAAWRAGLRVKLARPRLTPDVRTLLVLAIPGVLAAGIVQINLLVGTSIATTQAGAAVWLYYADRLYQLPSGVIGVALAVALLPDLSRRLAAGDARGAQDSQNLAVVSATGLTLPAAAGLYFLALPVVTLLFERGAFLAADRLATAQALRALCFGLPAFVMVAALQPSFFARQNTRVPLLYGAIGVVVNIIGSLTFFSTYGHVAIAYATSLAGWTTLVLMLAHMHIGSIWRMNAAVVARLLGQVGASILMSVGLFMAALSFAPPLGFWGLLAWVGAMVTGGGLVFGLAAWAMGGWTPAQIRSLRGRG